MRATHLIALLLGIIAASIVAMMMTAGLAGSVPSPQPVVEQNLDRNGDIKVHEQGTAVVHVGNESLSTSPLPATKSESQPVAAAASDFHQVSFPAIQASLITVRGLTGAADHVTFLNGVDRVLSFIGFNAGENIVLPLPQPVTVNAFLVACAPSADCAAEFNVVGS